jgi:hypothetical protein
VCQLDNIEVEPNVADEMKVHWYLQFSLDYNMHKITIATDATIVVSSLEIKSWITMSYHFKFVSLCWSIASKTWMGSIPTSAAC